MSRIFSISLATLSLMAASPVFADHDCSCDEQCAAACANGTAGDHCQCKDKDCHCAKGEGCKHGKCHTKDHQSQ